MGTHSSYQLGCLSTTDGWFYWAFCLRIGHPNDCRIVLVGGGQQNRVSLCIFKYQRSVLQHFGVLQNCRGQQHWVSLCISKYRHSAPAFWGINDVVVVVARRWRAVWDEAGNAGRVPQTAAGVPGWTASVSAGECQETRRGAESSAERNVSHAFTSYTNGVFLLIFKCCVSPDIQMLFCWYPKV